MTERDIKEVMMNAKAERKESFRTLSEKSGYDAQELFRVFKPSHDTRICKLIDICDALGLEIVVRKKPHVMEGGQYLYECDPEKNVTCTKTGCHIHGGLCHLTRIEEYAV